MKSKKSFFGLILILIGLMLLLRSLDLIDLDFGDFVSFLVPVFLIGLGFWVIIRRSRREQRESMAASFSYAVDDSDVSFKAETPDGTKTEFSTGSQSAHDKHEAGFSSSGPDETPSDSSARVSQLPDSNASGKVRFNKLLSDMYIDCSGLNLQNVEVSLGIGDLEVKLHGGKLASGLNRMIISSFIGDVRILVPKELAVFIHASNFIGDIEIFGKRTSGFGNNIDQQTTNYQTAQAKLYIATNLFVGDIIVYYV